MPGRLSSPLGEWPVPYPAVGDERLPGCYDPRRHVLPEVHVQTPATATLIVVVGLAALTQSPGPERDALIARAKSFELPTKYVPPPGNPLEHHAAGFAKVMCSAVFITGLEPDFAAENVGYFTAPYAERAKLGRPRVDRDHKAVQVAVPNGATRTSRRFGDQASSPSPWPPTINFADDQT